jgi:AraC-like DNA-binding protein
MTVFARSAMIRPIPDSGGLVDVRRGSLVRSGAYPHDGTDLVSRWHTHDLHQLIYASRGTAQIEAAGRRHLLPPQQAAIIPAGAEHRTTLRGAESVSVYLAPDLIEVRSTRVLAAVPLVREMINYSARWPIDRRDSDPLADSYFATLARLVGELAEDERSLYLPVPSDPVVRDAVAYTTSHLATAGEASLGRAIGVSPRTLRRRFQADLGMTWGRYARQLRLLSAMTLLAEPGPTVLEVARLVGFASPSAFTRAFRQTTGESPTAFRHRVTRSGPRVPTKCS